LTNGIKSFAAGMIFVHIIQFLMNTRFPWNICTVLVNSHPSYIVHSFELELRSSPLWQFLLSYLQLDPDVSPILLYTDS